jgi:hypothetical protein
METRAIQHRSTGVCRRDPIPSGLSSLSKIAVFGGSAHPLLAAEICTHLAVPLLPSRIERYANDCLGV